MKRVAMLPFHFLSFDFFEFISSICRMLKIRLQRVARKHIPIFRVVLTDSRNSTKSGKFHEVLGTYNLMTDEKRVDAERVKYWISKGAQPSGTVHNYLVGERIIPGKKINVLPRRRPIKKEEKGGGEASKEAVQKAEKAEGTPAPEAKAEAKQPAEQPVAKSE
ncbi:MAG: 30S ribosomal protein S16 [Patescibacteria group bacterium]